MARRQRRRTTPKITLAPVHDRMSIDLPINSKVDTIEVDDPFSRAGEKPDRIIVMRSVRDDPLAHMHSRRQVDEAQFQAGRQWQLFYARAAIGVVRAMDPAKEYVSGGAAPDILNDSQRIAINALREADVALGAAGSRMVHRILGDGINIHQFAADEGGHSWRDLKAWADEFAGFLNVLAVEFGFAMEPNLRKSQNSS
jgi:hypothetical protein